VISRAQIFRVHKWCALAACALILTQSVTGLVNVYRHEVAQMLDPAGMVRRSQDADVAINEVLRSLRSTYPDQDLLRIVFPPNRRGTYFAHLQGTKDIMFASIDPGSAIILRSGGLWSFASEASAQIHYDYTAGVPGIVVVALTGLASLIILVSGLAHWWPRRGPRLRQLGIDWRAPRKLLLRQLHRSTGVVISVLLSYSLVTGLVLATDYAVDGFAATRSSPTGLSAEPEVDLDTAIRQARSLFPNHDVRDIRFSDNTRANIFFWAPERSPRAVHQVSIDLDSRSAIKTKNAGTNENLWVTWLPLHTGESLGILGAALLVSNALALILLATTGPIMWINGARSRRRKSR
jgi:uncharacterized iron-regulated membrane protein